MPEAATEFSTATGLVCLAVVVILLGTAVLLRSRSRRRDTDNPLDGPVLGAAQLHPPEPVEDPDALSVDALAAQVDEQLVLTDNAVRAAPAPVRDAARRALADAYHLRVSKQDDRRKRLREILDRCTAAQDRLGADLPLDAEIEPLIRTLSRRRAELKARLPSAAVAEKKLSERYADSALTAVRGNIAEATVRLDLAGQQLSQASARLTGYDPEAGEAVRAAELTLAQVRTLVDAINTAGTELDAAQAAATALLTQAHTDIDARRVAGVSRRQETALARAEQVLAEVQADLASPRPDPLDAIRRTEATLTPLSTHLDEPARTHHALSTLDQTLFVVRSYVDAVDDFVATRPEYVGADARTELAEAQRCLDQAVANASNNPVAAVDWTRDAHAHADRAIQAARADAHS